MFKPIFILSFPEPVEVPVNEAHEIIKGPTLPVSSVEGFNSKISIIKNRAREFRNMKNFMDMIYFCCGDLDICFQPIM